MFDEKQNFMTSVRLYFLKFLGVMRGRKPSFFEKLSKLLFSKIWARAYRTTLFVKTVIHEKVVEKIIIFLDFGGTKNYHFFRFREDQNHHF